MTCFNYSLVGVGGGDGDESGDLTVIHYIFTFVGISVGILF